MKKTHGGARANSGAKPSVSEEMRRVQVNVKLPRWLAEWLRAQVEIQGRSQGVVIEQALCRVHYIKSQDEMAAMTPEKLNSLKVSAMNARKRFAK